MKYLLQITDENGLSITRECLNAVDLIAKMQEAISDLRRPQLRQTDLSYGEAPLPILAPSAEELAQFVRQTA